MAVNRNIIAIDGPAGSGKSTVARQVAAKIGFNYFDSGAYYRAVTYLLMEKAKQSGAKNADFSSWMENISPEEYLNGVVLECEFSDTGENRILLNGKDISVQIRTPEVTEQIKYIAPKRIYRDFVNKFIRALAENSRLVMDGRDIGTEVFPDAVYKIYLTASPVVRAQRRHKDLADRGIASDLQQLQKDIELRDKTDMEREIAPLKRADDAIFIDTSDMDKKLVIDKLLSAIELKKL